MRRLLLLLAIAPGPALAHVGGAEAAAPGWTLDAWITVPLALAAGLYGLGYARLRRRSDGGRRELGRRGGWFALGLFILSAAVVSPLHEAGERSFTAHMLEHELMMLAAAPLLVLGRPLSVMIWAFPARGRAGLAALARSRAVAGLWRLLAGPAAATGLQAAALWLWHVPFLFDLALAHEGWHVAQHASFLITALLFWSAMLGPRRSAWVSAVCLFLTAMISGALGALMAMAEGPWYARYAMMGLAPMGLTPAQDQQLAGILMWVPGGLVHAAAALALLAPHLRDPKPPKEPAHV